MSKPSHEERIAKALAEKAEVEAKLKRLQEAEAKRINARLNSIASKTGMLAVCDDLLIPELEVLVAKLITTSAEVTQ